MEPAARGHLCSREPFAPAAFSAVGQIDEWASGYLKFLEMREQHAPEFGREASADAAGI